LKRERDFPPEKGRKGFLKNQGTQKHSLEKKRGDSFGGRGGGRKKKEGFYSRKDLQRKLSRLGRDRLLTGDERGEPKAGYLGEMELSSLTMRKIYIQEGGEGPSLSEGRQIEQIGFVNSGGESTSSCEKGERKNKQRIRKEKR